MYIRKSTVVFIFFIFVLVAQYIISSNGKNKNTTDSTHITKKILFINSYHQGYQWSDQVTEVIEEYFKRNINVELEVFYMKTKGVTDDNLKKQMAIKAMEMVTYFKPDVIISCDDNAAKYLIKEHLSRSDIPVVYCGISSNGAEYGLPTPNTTGITDYNFIDTLISRGKEYSEVRTVGYLAGNNITDRNHIDNFYKNSGYIQLDTVFVDNLEDWKTNFIALQSRVDMLILGLPPVSDYNWNYNTAIDFTNKNTRITTCCYNEYMVSLSLIGVLPLAKEQGLWVAKAAEKIAFGAPIETIKPAVSQNTISFFNERIGKKLAINRPQQSDTHIKIITEQPDKIFFVNSYHKGYEWSDNIEKGIANKFSAQYKNDSTTMSKLYNVEIRTVYMDSKNRTDSIYLQNKAAELYQQIKEYKPNIIIAADDVAAKYLLVPYFRDSTTPAVFCGINIEASKYGFPADNITGVLEVPAVYENIKLAKRLAKGDRIGVIGAKTYSTDQLIHYFVNDLKLNLSSIKQADTFEAFKKAYIDMQRECDMAIMIDSRGYRGWDDDEAIEFLKKNSTIPTVGTADHVEPFSMIGKIITGNEQGWKAASLAYMILRGTPPSEIPITTNKATKQFINFRLTKAANIMIPGDMILNNSSRN